MSSTDVNAIARNRVAASARSPAPSTQGSVTSLSRRPASAFATRNHPATSEVSPTASGPATRRGSSDGSIRLPATGRSTRVIVCWSTPVPPSSQSARPLASATAMTASSHRSQVDRQ